MNSLVVPQAVMIQQRLVTRVKVEAMASRFLKEKLTGNQVKSRHTCVKHDFCVKIKILLTCCPCS